MSELAKREKRSRRYAARLIQLSFLAPDIMQAIGRSNTPPALSLNLLKKPFHSTRINGGK